MVGMMGRVCVGSPRLANRPASVTKLLCELEHSRNHTDHWDLACKMGDKFSCHLGTTCPGGLTCVESRDRSKSW